MKMIHDRLTPVQYGCHCSVGCHCYLEPSGQECIWQLPVIQRALHARIQIYQDIRRRGRIRKFWTNVWCHPHLIRVYVMCQDVSMPTFVDPVESFFFTLGTANQIRSETCWCRQHDHFLLELFHLITVRARIKEKLINAVVLIRESERLYSKS